LSGRIAIRPDNAPDVSVKNQDAYPAVPNHDCGSIAVMVNERHRQSIRLLRYDYTQAGAYFVTICTHNRECLFGEVNAQGEMMINDLGRLVERCWNNIPSHFPNIALDTFVVMPNHVHGIIVINTGATHASPLQRRSGPLQHSIGAMVGSFKSAATRHINQHRQISCTPVWQRNYYEHIIRNEESLNRIRQYIIDNPARWAFDDENPSAILAEM
jgi:REP element-mobilizing transposase RayT